MLYERGLELLDEEECRHLVARCSVGRVAFTLGGTPLVLPVNYALTGSTIVFRTADGAKLRAAHEHQLSAFEVDQIDPVYHRGWSVLAIGPLGEVTDPAELARLASVPVRPWAYGERAHWLAVRVEVWSGRRIAPASDA